MSMNDSTLSGVLRGISVWSPELSTGGPILGEKNIPLMAEERAKCQAECLKMGNTRKMTISWGKMIINNHTNSNENLTSFYLGLGWEENVSQLLKGASGPSDGACWRWLPARCMDALGGNVQPSLGAIHLVTNPQLEPITALHQNLLKAFVFWICIEIFDLGVATMF